MPPSGPLFHRACRCIRRIAVATGLLLATLAAPHANAAQPAAADRALALGDFPVALLWTAAALKANPDDPLLRARAGNLIRHIPLLRQTLVHGAGVNVVAFSPDGRGVLTASGGIL